MIVTLNLFVYGTLQNPEVFRRVTGRRLVAQAATLNDYARYRLHGLCYPGVITEFDAVTEGLLIEGLEPREMNRLDAFEDDFYRRDSVTVTTHSGLLVRAEVYVIPSDQRDLIDPHPWNLDDFVLSEWSDLPRRFCMAGPPEPEDSDQ